MLYGREVKKMKGFVKKMIWIFGWGLFSLADELVYFFTHNNVSAYSGEGATNLL